MCLPILNPPPSSLPTPSLKVVPEHRPWVSCFMYQTCCCCCLVASVTSDSVRPHRRQPTRLPRPWDSPGKNTGVGCHFLLQCRKVKSESEDAQSYPTLSDPMDCSLPGSSVHGIFQARTLEWVAISFSLHLLSILHMIMHTFQCSSIKSSHPRLLPGVQTSVRYICVSFAALHTQSLLLFF